jgi:hypothetical protein
VKSIMHCVGWDKLAQRTPAHHSGALIAKLRWAGLRRASLVPPSGVVAALFLVIALAAPSTCRADAKSEGPLYGKVELRFQRCRTGAPIPVVWEIHWDEQAIIEGQLDFDILDDGNQLLSRFQIPDLVLSPGKNVFNGMVPTMSVYSRSAPVNVRARFTSGKRTFELDEQSLRVPNKFAQWFNLGLVSGGSTKSSREETRALEAIRWERLLPNTDMQDRSTTAIIDLETPALPVEPLALCNFDVIALLPPALVEIRDEQMTAVKKWVLAGGSLCVIAGGGLTPRHAAIINELMAESSGHEAFVVDRQGFLAPGQAVEGEIDSARLGLGRVVVLREALFQKLKPDAKEWLEATAFLMKARREIRQTNLAPGQNSSMPMGAIAPNWPPVVAPQPKTRAGAGRKQKGAPSSKSNPSSSKKSPSSPAVVPAPGGGFATQQPAIQLRQSGRMTNQGMAVSPAWRLQYDPTYGMRSELSPTQLYSLSGLFQLLMPRDVQMVPLGLIAAVLAAYVCAIGPIDYLLLGALRIRRFTWILFPVVTIAFAGFTLWLSRWYLGTNDSRQALEIHDIVKGGTVARRTRVELLFLSRERDVGTDVQNGAYSPIGLGVTADFRRMGMAPSMQSERSGQASYRGRFPGHYVVDQAVPQWSPVVNRFFWIDPKPAKVETSPGADPAAHFNWDDLGDVTTTEGRDALAKRIRQAFGKSASAALFRGSGDDVETTILTRSFDRLRALLPNGRPEEIGIGQIVQEISARAPQKLFALASQVSPNGGPDLEDLALLDQTDPRQSLLVIGVQNGSDLVLYRHLYTKGP